MTLTAAGPRDDGSNRGRFERNTPHEAVPFEYRIDRKHRLLRRDHMFANALHPRGLKMDPGFLVCNSIHSTSLRCGLMSMAPGRRFEFPDYPNEHFLLQVSGAATWSVEGRSYAVSTGDQLFTPAYTAYVVENAGDDEAWFLSCYLRVATWVGLPPEYTPAEPGCEDHRFLAAPQAAPDLTGPGWRQWTGLSASRNASRVVEIEPGGRLAPQHQIDELIAMPLGGWIDWHVDGVDLATGPEDLLFIPALAPFSCQNSGTAPVRLVLYDVALTA
jgi:mannose-6-phosphate isomerase-like protein (cupin superfamily)